MPDFAFTQALTANQADYRPLAAWRYRRLPWRALVSILMRTTGAAGNVKQTIDAGAQNIVQKSPMTVGGTAGVQPVPQNTPVIQFIGDAGDELVISIDETAGATPTVDGYVNVEPA